MAAPKKRAHRRTGRPRGRPRSERRERADRAVAEVLARFRREEWSRETLDAMLRHALRELLTDEAGQSMARRAVRRGLTSIGVRRRGAWIALPGEPDRERRQLRIEGT